MSDEFQSAVYSIQTELMPSTRPRRQLIDIVSNSLLRIRTEWAVEDVCYRVKGLIDLWLDERSHSSEGGLDEEFFVRGEKYLEENSTDAFTTRISWFVRNSIEYLRLRFTFPTRELVCEFRINLLDLPSTNGQHENRTFCSATFVGNLSSSPVFLFDFLDVHSTPRS